MAAKAIVVERKAKAIIAIRGYVAEITGSHGIDIGPLGQFVKGSADYQEMVRTEQVAELLKVVAEKVKKPEPPPETSSPVAAPVVTTFVPPETKPRKPNR